VRWSYMRMADFRFGWDYLKGTRSILPLATTRRSIPNNELSNSARPAWDGNGYDAVALEVIVRSVVLIVSPAARGGGGLVRYFASTVWHTTNKKSDRHDHDIFTLKISHDLIRSLRRSIYRQYCFSDFRSFQNIKPLYVLYLLWVLVNKKELLRNLFIFLTGARSWVCDGRFLNTTSDSFNFRLLGEKRTSKVPTAK
jgi:hypothetical protein